MASISSIGGGGNGGGGHKKGPGVKKAKKMSTLVDMTPFVDIVFLLITFFIFTTTMSAPTTMDLFMPKDTKKDEELTKAKESGALTILLAKDDQVFYFAGQLAEDASNFLSTSFDPKNGIRKVIIDKKRSTPEDDLVIIIKPNEEATYKNTVDILDEMTINQIKRFALVDITPVENELIKRTQEAGINN